MAGGHVSEEEQKIIGPLLWMPASAIPTHSTYIRAAADAICILSLSPSARLPLSLCGSTAQVEPST